MYCLCFLACVVCRFLDALVVKQGRLHDSEKSVTSSELAEMVRFGANRIFHSAEGDSEITDADIDLILARGTEMTRAENEKLQQNTQNDLLNFNLSDDTQENFQMFEGKDYRGVSRMHTLRTWIFTSICCVDMLASFSLSPVVVLSFSLCVC
jgi:hypothetical protein